MPQSTEQKTELVEAARAMVAPEPQFGQFWTDALTAAENFQMDAERRKTQNETP